jgi:hypothetical protein
VPQRPRGLTFGAVLAAAVFVSVAVAMTGIVHGSGNEIVDTTRYQLYAEAMESDLVPYRDFDVEYPPAALAVFLVPALASNGETEYFWTFAALMALFGACGVLLTSIALAQLDRRQRSRRTILALVAISPVLFGGVLLTRFDLAPAALVALATVLLLGDRPRSAALAIGVGAALKWYPLVLLPLLAVWVWRRQGRRDAGISCALSLGVVALAYAPFLILGPSDVTDSVWRQASRPLQVESLGAGMLVVLHHLAGVELVVETSYGSQNLTGDLATSVALGLSLAGAGSLAWVWLSFAQEHVGREQFVRLGAAALLGLVAFGKVLSPQFLVWLVFPLVLVSGRRGAAAGACFAVAAVATAIWFPWRYFDLPRELDPFVASLVVVRGLGLAAAFAILAWPERTTAPRSSPRPPAATGE